MIRFVILDLGIDFDYFDGSRAGLFVHHFPISYPQRVILHRRWHSTLSLGHLMLLFPYFLIDLCSSPNHTKSVRLGSHCHRAHNQSWNSIASFGWGALPHSRLAIGHQERIRHFFLLCHWLKSGCLSLLHFQKLSRNSFDFDFAARFGHLKVWCC